MHTHIAHKYIHYTYIVMVEALPKEIFVIDMLSIVSVCVRTKERLNSSSLRVGFPVISCVVVVIYAHNTRTRYSWHSNSFKAISMVWWNALKSETIRLSWFACWPSNKNTGWFLCRRVFINLFRCCTATNRVPLIECQLYCETGTVYIAFITRSIHFQVIFCRCVVYGENPINTTWIQIDK